ncbi:MAG: alpha/beta hydrolase [Caulobacteraceae bacterium]|jgi:pimeloyl-ACP methyl ester carboxylesterase|nr:alpha/beta hydrolase [Caulobacteraceae bacterium]
MTGFAEQHLTRDKLQLYARDYAAASGPARLPVLCLHGLTRNSADFAEIAVRLSSGGRRVLAPDMRGRGLSAYDPQPMNYVPQVYADDVLAWLDALGIAKAIFIGTSMGGVITVALAARRRSAIAGAILNDVGPVASPEGLARIAGYAGKPVQIESWADAAAYARALNSDAHPDLDDSAWADFARRTFREDANGRPMLNYDPAIAVPIKAGLLTVPPALAWRLFTRLAKGRPALLLRGANSDILSRETASKLHAKVRTIRVAEIANVGHAPLLTEPEAWRAICGFLAELP